MKQKTGHELFYYDGSPTDFMLNDFWRWSSSDLLNNTQRGVLAEYIVAKALNIETDGPRVDWEPFDLLLFGRWRIEVKASSYVQSWAQSSDSTLRFSIRPTRAWDSENGYATQQLRHSDMYIFCVFAERDREAADPMMLDKWEFYPVLTSEINAMLESQQSASLSTVLRLCPEVFDYSELLDAVLWLMSCRQDTEARERIEAHRALLRAKKPSA
jgi:hypothetical protein